MHVTVQYFLVYTYLIHSLTMKVPFSIRLKVEETRKYLVQKKLRTAPVNVILLFLYLSMQYEWQSVLVELVATGYSDKPDLGNARALHEFIEFNGVQPFLDAFASPN